MHHQVAVRVLHGFQHLQEQDHPLAQAQAPRIAPGVDGHAIHVFHDEVRITLRTDTAIQQRGDVRVLQARQGLSLAQETFAGGGGIGTAAYQLQCRMLRVGTIVPLDLVHRTHAAMAQHAGDAPGAQAAADQTVFGRCLGFILQHCTPGNGITRERLFTAGVCCQQGIHPGAQLGIARTGFQQALLALACLQLNHFLEQQEGAALELHICRSHAPISASRKARALRQSRRTVR